MIPTSWRLAGGAAAWSLVNLPCIAQASTPELPPAVAPASEPSLLPHDAVAAATRIHPHVLAAQISLERARGEAAQLRLLLHNPQVSAGTSVDGRRTSGALAQPLSLTGEGAAARRAASAHVDAAQLQLRRARLEAAAGCRRAYVDAIVRSRQVDIALEGRGLATQLRDAVSRQLEVGEASTLELRLAELALVQASARLLEARQAEATALRQLSALTGVALQAEALVDDPRSVAPTTDSPTGVGTRSDLLAIQSTVQQATAERTRQRARVLSPVSLGASVNIEDDERFIGPTLQVTLPLFDRNQADRWTAEAAVDRARIAEHSLLAKIQTEQHTAQLRVTEARELEDHGLQEPLAEARAALASIGVGYRSGEIDLPSAILLQKEVLAGESAALSLLGGIALAQIDLLLANDDPSLLGTADSASQWGTP